MGVSLGSVAGALAIVFARRLAQKRIAPQVKVDEAGAMKVKELWNKMGAKIPQREGPDLSG